MLAILGALFAMWKSLPEVTTIEFSNSIKYVFSDHELADVQVGPFRISGVGSDSTVWLKTKIERKLVEFFVDKGLKTLHPLTTEQSFERAQHTIGGEIQADGGGKIRLSVDVRNLQGLTISSMSFEETSDFYAGLYRELPETIWYSMAVDPISFKPVNSRVSTSPSAYAYYLSAKRSVTHNKIDEAQQKLHRALVIDPYFAMAYWALGEINNILDKLDKARGYYAKATAIDPDHPKHPISNKVPVPLPRVFAEMLNTSWEQVADGMVIKSIRIDDYAINIEAVRFRSDLYGIKMAVQLETTGTNAKDFLMAHDAILAINGGFYEIDEYDRLSPSGLLIINGQEKAAYHKRGGSGFLYDTGTTVEIGWSKNANKITDVKFAVQSGPLVVDPGGKNGILVDNHDQRRRSTFCLNQNTASVILVDGHLSLYELGELLSTDQKHGGFGCERAINLDGGASSQLYFDYRGHRIDVAGTWKTNNAILVIPRASRN